MSSPLTEHVLFTTLREYASRLEVQYMIEEEVKKFQKKVLPRLLSEACATVSHATSEESTAGGRTAGAADRRVSSSSPPFTAAPSDASATPNPEWVQTFLKAHVEDVVGRRLPLMIAHEVQRQLRRANERAQAGSSEVTPSLSRGSPPCDEAAASTEGARAHPGSLALPRSPPRPPRVPQRETTAESAETSPVEHQRDVNRDFAVVTSTARDDGRRQRERILSAIADMARQLTVTQRDLNGVLHQQRLSRCRLEYLCESLEGVSLSPVTGREPPSLCAALEQALDDRQADVVRARIVAILQGLLLQWTELQPGRGAGPQDQATLALSNSPSPARQAYRPSYASLPSSKSPKVRGSSHYTPPQKLTRSPSLLHCDSPSPLPAATGAAGTPPAQSPYLSGTVPVNSALTSARTLTYNRHCDAAATDREAAQPSASTSTRAVRSIKTRGTVPSPAPLSMQQPPVFKTANAMAPSSPPISPEQSRARLDAGEAASRLMSLPQECVDSSMCERARRDTCVSVSMCAADVLVTNATSAASPERCTSHSMASPRGVGYRNVSSPSITSAAPSRKSASSRLASRAVLLGIEALNVPSGLLPGALSRQGAVRVQSVAPMQLAERAGVCRGDVLLSVDHRPVGSCEELRNVLAAVPATQLSVEMELYRQTIHQILSITLPL